jgi:glycosyltransferase involved in cell wall biosynthesis
VTVELSVVIAARNAAADLPVQLDALLAQQWDGEWEIVVVDNGSTDGTAAVVEAYAQRDARVRLVPAPDARGAGAVRNAGVQATSSVAVAMCDADDVVGPEWVTAMGDGLRSHDCVTGPLEVRALNPAWLVRTRGVPSATAPSTFHGLFPLLPAGNVGLRRAVWDAAGGFDPAVFANEDTDLSLRVHQQRADVFFDPRATIGYRYRSEARVLFAQGLRYGRSRAMVARRVRDAGLRVPRVAGWRSWLVLVGWLPRLTSPEGRASWCWVAGVRFGLLRGCVQYRVVYF